MRSSSPVGCMEPGMTREIQAWHLSKLISSQGCNMCWRTQCQVLKRLSTEPNALAGVALRVLELMGTTGEKGVAACIAAELEVAAPSGWQ